MAGVDGDAELGAHPVGRGDEDRVAVARGLQVEKRAKAAQPRHCPGPRGALRGGLDPLDEGVARIDVHPRLGIGQPVLPPRHLPSPAIVALRRGIQDKSGRDNVDPLTRVVPRGYPASRGRRVRRSCFSTSRIAKKAAPIATIGTPSSRGTARVSRTRCASGR